MSDLQEAVSKNYDKFFAKFKEIEEKPVSDWNKINVLSYLCKRYKSYYNMEFTFSFKGTPSKCREVYEISKMSQMLSSQPDILKSYIDWVFDTKIIERKKRIGSLGYFTHPEIINEFKFLFLFNKKLDRSSELHSKHIAICKEFGYDIGTYGELAFLFQAGEPKLFSSLSDNGFNLEMLKGIV